MTAQDVRLLARYNSEVARGLTHNTDWKLKMLGLQGLWDAEENAMNGRAVVEYQPISPFLLIEDL